MEFINDGVTNCLQAVDGGSDCSERGWGVVFSIIVLLRTLDILHGGWLQSYNHDAVLCSLAIVLLKTFYKYSVESESCLGRNNLVSGHSFRARC